MGPSCTNEIPVIDLTQVLEDSRAIATATRLAKVDHEIRNELHDNGRFYPSHTFSSTTSETRHVTATATPEETRIWNRPLVAPQARIYPGSRSSDTVDISTASTTAKGTLTSSKTIIARSIAPRLPDDAVAHHAQNSLPRLAPAAPDARRVVIDLTQDDDSTLGVGEIRRYDGGSCSRKRTYNGDIKTTTPLHERTRNENATAATHSPSQFPVKTTPQEQSPAESDQKCSVTSEPINALISDLPYEQQVASNYHLERELQTSPIATAPVKSGRALSNLNGHQIEASATTIASPNSSRRQKTVRLPRTVEHLRLPQELSSCVTENTRVLYSKMVEVIPIYLDRRSQEEDRLLVHLKEDLSFKWTDIALFFPHRGSWNTLQTRYSKQLKDRHIRVENRSDDLNPEEKNVDHAKSSVARPSDRASVNADSSDNAIIGSVALKRTRRVKATREAAFAIGADTHGTASPITRVPEEKDGSVPTKTCIIHEKDRDAAAIASGTGKIFREAATTPQAYHHTVATGSSKAVKRRSLTVLRPYLSKKERAFVRKSITLGLWDDKEMLRWNGVALHVDFTQEETGQLLEIATNLRVVSANNSLPLIERLAQILRKFEGNDIAQLLKQAEYCGSVLQRTRSSVESFISDLLNNELNQTASSHRLYVSSTEKVHSLNRRLRHRELGGTVSWTSAKANREIMRDNLYRTMGPAYSFTGTSGDVNSVAWSPNGELFAAGSTTCMDTANMQYNRPKNLILGNAVDGELAEIPMHAKRRIKPEQGANSTDEMQNSQDSLIFSSLSCVKFSPDGKTLCSAGWDKCVRLWDVSSGLHDWQRRFTISHQAEVDLLALNRHGMIATGSKRKAAREGKVPSIKILSYNFDTPHIIPAPRHSLSSPKAFEKLESEITPSSLVWGDHMSYQANFLLAGFSSNTRDFGEGQICIWDAELEQPTAICRGGTSVFDTVWSPHTFGRFAAGCTAKANVNRGTRSVVQIFDSRLLDQFNVDKRWTFELECAALDQNDVLFNSRDSNLISVSCTDGRCYVWDLRRPNQYLQTFVHGPALQQLDIDVAPEVVDTGIRFTSWDLSARKIYTGSSDGVVACWNPYVSYEDAYEFTVTTLQSGVMSGSFSPAGDGLLLGEVNGTVSLLSIGREDQQSYAPFQFPTELKERAEQEKDTLRTSFGTQALSDQISRNEGALAGQELLLTGEMRIVPFAGFPNGQAVQGPNYNGPSDQSEDAPELRARALTFQERHVPGFHECKLEHDVMGSTLEEQGDAGYWRTKIPGNIRYPGPLSLSTIESARENEFICSTCEKPLGSFNHAKSCDDVIECASCKRSWRVDVLGFTSLDWHTREPIFDAEYEEAMRLGMEQFKLTEEKGSP